ncbi:hypothetical protein ASE90_16740 [Sphingomonas sp. Leaf67]|nr:hypothetical protein ASE90_16740 [Sphingomonas sp. Leaf67]
MAARTDQARTAISLQFRRELTLRSRPARMMVRVSADNRFVLYVNGQRVAAGPARGDLDHWRYERVDLAPFLRVGANVIAAEVWSDGRDAPRAQISARTAFYLVPDDTGAMPFADGTNWLVRVDGSRSVSSGMAQLIDAVGGTYYVAGAPETLDGARQRPDWAAVRSSAPDWVPAVPLATGSDTPWHLMPDTLPQMRYETAPAGRLVRARGTAAGRFPQQAVTVPAHGEATFLVDAGAVEAAYPELVVSGGAGAEVTLTYTEALYSADKKRLQDRAAVGDGQALGLRDTFRPSGAAEQRFQPFWWRVWRFAELHVKTGDQPLRLVRFRRYRTGYPFKARAWFRSSDPALDRVWQIGWDTLRLDAHETFMDTAYWEQLQYAGDSRIEALIADTVSGDGRLSAQMLRAFDASRTPRAARESIVGRLTPAVAGLPQAAYPSGDYQSIPPFGLFWIGSLADYRMRWPDPTPVRESLPGMRIVLDWYARLIGANGLVGKGPAWTFIDWKPNLEGNPTGPDTKDDNGCVVSLAYLGALQEAAELEDELGDASIATRDRHRADGVAKAVRAHCWSAERGLYADSTGLKNFSQHANLLAVLYDVAPSAQHRAIMDRITVRNGGITAPNGVTGTSYYFSYYLARAAVHAGLSERYFELLRTWRDMLGQNFTTWPENPEPSRSDSHAWSAHPTADLLRIVAGISPASAGYATVRIAPNLGPLTQLDAAVPHPSGLIRVRYRRSGNGLTAIITLPAGLSGKFDYAGRSWSIGPGTRRLSIHPERGTPAE